MKTIYAVYYDDGENWAIWHHCVTKELAGKMLEKAKHYKTIKPYDKGSQYLKVVDIPLMESEEDDV